MRRDERIMSRPPLFSPLSLLGCALTPETGMGADTLLDAFSRPTSRLVASPLLGAGGDMTQPSPVTPGQDGD